MGKGMGGQGEGGLPSEFFEVIGHGLCCSGDFIFIE